MGLNNRIPSRGKCREYYNGLLAVFNDCVTVERRIFKNRNKIKKCS